MNKKLKKALTAAGVFVAAVVVVQTILEVGFGLNGTAMAVGGVVAIAADQLGTAVASKFFPDASA